MTERLHLSNETSEISALSIQKWIEALARQIEEAFLRRSEKDSPLASEQGELIFVGIVRGGDVLARRLNRELQKRGCSLPKVYHIDITLYRDDLYTGLERPTLGGSNLPLNLDGKRVLLVDDVLFTGRTIRAAIQEIMDYGRPQWMKLLVLLDRGGRELPIQPDFVGQKIELPKNTKISVHLEEVSSEKDTISIETVHGKGG